MFPRLSVHMVFTHSNTVPFMNWPFTNPLLVCIMIVSYAGMTELADVQDLGSCAARRVGSTPTTRTKQGASRKGLPLLQYESLMTRYIVRHDIQ